MATSTKQATFSDTKKMVLHNRNVSKWIRNIFTELSAWVLGFLLLFVLMEIVIWVAAISTL